MRGGPIESIGIAFSLAGHIAGPQFNAARVNYTAGMTDCLMAPLWAKSFDNKVFAGEKRSTYSTMSKSAKGVQTGVTFMQWIKTLRVEIDAFSAADVACGLPPIEFPVMLLSDNHGSRFDFDVLESVSTEEAVAEAKKLGLALWLEESKVSHFLQMPDRITKMSHSVYTKDCKQYKKTHEFHYGYTCTIGLCEFLEIWGGCREMNYEGAWFSWCSPQTVLAAWRAVGFFPGGLDPTQIDRSNFFDRVVAVVVPEPECSDLPELEDVLATPTGMRAGSIPALKRQLAAATEMCYKQQAVIAKPLDMNAVPGLMDPKIPRKPPKTARSGMRVEQAAGGDVSLRGLGGSARHLRWRRHGWRPCVRTALLRRPSASRISWT